MPKAGHDREVRGNSEKDGDKLTVWPLKSWREIEGLKVYREQAYVICSSEGQQSMKTLGHMFDYFLRVPLP